ncbi:MAG: hypothetical protein ABI835_01060, partial [Chloroflexota bacterium]
QDFLDDFVEPDRSPYERQSDSTPVPAAEPDFLDDLAESDLSRFEPPRDPTDTQPRQPDVFAQPQESPAELTESLVELRHLGEETEPYPALRQPESAPAPTQQSVEQVTASIPDLGEETRLDLDADATVPVDEAQTQPGMPPVSEPPSRSAEPTPNNKASIWEIFGVPRPSETQEARQLVAASDKLEDESDTLAFSEPELTPAEPVVESSAPEPAPEALELAEVIAVPEPPPAEPLSLVVTPDSETTRVEPVAAPDVLLTIKPSALTVELPGLPTRLGLRIVMRRRLIRLRHP